MSNFVVSVYGVEKICEQLINTINAMYIEFINTTGEIPQITPDKLEGIDYYNNLKNTTNQDFLRVPVTLKGLDKSDPDSPTYNTINVAAIANGTGYFGKPFGANSNSKIIGAAAVIADWAEQDIGKDVVVLRQYFSPDQIVVVSDIISHLISVKFSIL